MVVNCSYELLNSRLLHPYIFFNVCRKLWRQSVRDWKEDSQRQRLTVLHESLVFSKRACAARPSQAAQDLGLGPLKWEVNTFVKKSKDLKKPGSLKGRLWCHVELGLWLKRKLCFWVFPMDCLVRRLLDLGVGDSLEQMNLDFSEGRSSQDHILDSFKWHSWKRLWPHSSIATTGFRDVIGRILRWYDSYLPSQCEGPVCYPSQDCGGPDLIRWVFLKRV